MTIRNLGLLLLLAAGISGLAAAAPAPYAPGVPHAKVTGDAVPADVRPALIRALARDTSPLHWIANGNESPAPLAWLEEQILAASDASEAGFGYSIARDGDTVIVGAKFATVNGNGSQGAAYVFEMSLDGELIETQKLVAADGAPSDGFGGAVALDGRTAIIAADYLTVTQSHQGAAYIFTRSNGTWSQTQKLLASDAAQADGIGTTVALEGTTAMIGAFNGDGVNADQGAVYVFSETANGVWEESQKLTASDGASLEGFGSSLALHGSMAIIGAYLATIDGNAGQGAAYVFENANGNWSETQKLTSSIGAVDDLFGSSIAFDDSTAIIGASYATVDGKFAQGTAYVFSRSGGLWSETQKLTASDGGYADLFGVSVALDGSAALVGANFNPGKDGPGAAYMFTETNGVWTETQKITASNGENLDSFGFAVTLSGSLALVGAPNAGPVRGGAVYAFRTNDPVFADGFEE